MREELHLMELVDRYLDGALDAAGATAFTARLSGSSELRLLVDDQRALREGLQRLPVRAAIMQAHRSWSWTKWGPQFGGAVVVAGLITGGVLYTLRAEHTAQTEQPAPVVREELLLAPVDSIPADSIRVDTVRVVGSTTEEAGDTTLIRERVRAEAVGRPHADTVFALVPGGKNMRLVQQVLTDEDQQGKAQRSNGVTLGPTVGPFYQQPSYPGGFAAMYAYLKANVYYPVNDTNQGTVMIGFDITARGAVDNATVVESLDEACDAEALRVIRAMPRWTPAQSKGKWVPSHVEVPLQFKQAKAAPAKAH